MEQNQCISNGNFRLTSACRSDVQQNIVIDYINWPKELVSHVNVIAISTNSRNFDRKSLILPSRAIDINGPLQRFGELEDTTIDLQPNPHDLKVEEYICETHSQDKKEQHVERRQLRYTNGHMRNRIEIHTIRLYEYLDLRDYKR